MGRLLCTKKGVRLGVGVGAGGGPASVLAVPAVATGGALLPGGGAGEVGPEERGPGAVSKGAVGGGCVRWWWCCSGVAWRGVVWYRMVYGCGLVLVWCGLGVVF